MANVISDETLQSLSFPKRKKQQQKKTWKAC